MIDLSVDTLQVGYIQESSLSSGHYSGYIFKPLEYTPPRTFFAVFAQPLSITGYYVSNESIHMGKKYPDLVHITPETHLWKNMNIESRLPAGQA